MVLIGESLLESFDKIVPEGFIHLQGPFVHFFFELSKLFFLPGIYSGTVHVTEHGNDSGEGLLHGVIETIDCCP